MSYHSTSPLATQFAEVVTDMETGPAMVKQLMMAVDCGRMIITDAEQMEGGLLQALGFSHYEETICDEYGRQVNIRFGPDYLYKAKEAPALDVILVQTDEPSELFGAKAVAEISMDGVCMRELPVFLERVWQAIRQAANFGRKMT